MVTNQAPLTGPRLMAMGLRRLFRRPFLDLLALDVMVNLAAASAPLNDAWSGYSSLVLACISTYLAIAVTLAAAQDEPEHSPDSWLRAAFRRRCFWRFAITGLAVLLLVAVGALGLVVGAFVVAGAVGLAQPAAALEHRWPGDSLRRSAELSRTARGAVATVYCLLEFVPAVAVQAAYYFGIDADLGTWWLAVGSLSIVPTAAGQIALTQAFVRLGGLVQPDRSREPIR